MLAPARTRSSSWKCASEPSIQRMRVAQLAVGFDGGLEDFRADALVVPVVGLADPQPQNVGAGLLDDVLRLDAVLQRLRHLAAVLVEREAVGQHHVERRIAARAAGFEQRGLKPAAVLVGAFEIHHGVGAAVALAPDAGEAGKVLRVFQHEGMGRAGIEPDVENVVDLGPFVGVVLGLEEARAPRRWRTRRRRLPARRRRRCAC